VRLPGWPPRDWRAILALIASVGGAGVLTVFSWRIVTILRDIGHDDPARREQVITILGNSNYGLQFIIGVVLISLGLAINRRSVKGNVLGASFEASGGDDDPVTPAIEAAARGAASGATQPNP
jgi:hypothetical protein